MAGDRIIASAHIRCRNLSEYMKIAEQVKEFFHNEGIHSTTIQPEFIDVSRDRILYNSVCISYIKRMYTCVYIHKTLRQSLDIKT